MLILFCLLSLVTIIRTIHGYLESIIPMITSG